MDTEAPKPETQDSPGAVPQDAKEFFTKLTQLLDQALNPTTPPDGEKKVGFGCFVFNAQGNVTFISNVDARITAMVIKPWLNQIAVKDRAKARRTANMKRVK